MSNRIPLRVITITLSDDAEAVERIMDHLVDDDFPCCDGTDEHECSFIAASATKLYMDTESGIEFEKPEGGLPYYTAELDDYMKEIPPEDWTEAEICDEVLTIDQGEDHWVLACTQLKGHDSPHTSGIVW